MSDTEVCPTCGALPCDWTLRPAPSDRKTVRGMSDALGFAKAADNGSPVKIYSVSEFMFEGIRFNPGSYEIRKLDAPETDSKPEF